MSLNMNGSGIDCTYNYNDFLSSTLRIDSPCATDQQCDLSHNVSNGKTLYTVASATMSINASSPDTSRKAPQTTTLPIQTIHASSQTLAIDAVSMHTMNNIIEEEDQCTFTEMADERRTQTDIVKVVEKTTF